MKTVAAAAPEAEVAQPAYREPHREQPRLPPCSLPPRRHHGPWAGLPARAACPSHGLRWCGVAFLSERAGYRRGAGGQKLCCRIFSFPENFWPHGMS